MAHDWRNAAAPPEIDDGPERAQCSRGNHSVPPLHHMSEAEGGTEHHNADGGTTEMTFETLKEKSALQFLAYSASDDRDDSK